MDYKRLISIAVLFLLLVFPASASMVSFLVVETGLGEEANTQYGSIWEGGLMEVFFDAGHIVTNCPIARIEKRPENDISGPIGNDFFEAAVNGAEYFVLCYLEFQNKSRSVPNAMVIKIYHINEEKLIYERSFPAGTGRSLGDEYQNALNTGRTIVSNIKDM
jgi:hypothetical protein